MLNVSGNRCRAVSQRLQHIDAFPVRKSTIPERFYKNWGKCWFGQVKLDLRPSPSGWPAYSCAGIDRWAKIAGCFLNADPSSQAASY